MRKYLLATTGLFAACAAHAQSCGSIPGPAAAAGYMTQTFGGPIVPGQNWTGSAGDGVTQNSDGSVTIASPTNNNYNAQLASTISVGGGAYIQGTLQALGPVTTNGGSPSIWLYDHEQRTTDRTEVDIAEVYGSTYGSALHDGNGPPGMPMSAATNTNLPQIPVDLSQPTTFGVLLKPGSAQFYLNGNPVGPATTWSPGGPFSITDQSHLTIALGTGQTPVRFSNVQVWQSSSANDVGATSSATPCGAPANTGAAAEAASSTPSPAVAQAASSVTDPQGNTWSVSASGNVMEGGTPVPGGGDTAAIKVVNGVVGGLDNGNGPVCPGCWFTLGAGRWTQHPGETPPDDTPPATTPVTTCNGNGQGGSGFRVVNGRIQGPSGDFTVRGINIYGTSAAASDPTAVVQTLKGLNFVRYIARPLNDPSTYDAFVNVMTSQGRVVEFEDHPDGGGSQGTVYTGARLAAESAWYAAMAAHFRSNPYVWFGTYNEPPTAGGSLSAWQQATYQAIRGAGNNSPIMIEVSGSRPWNLQQALDPSAYAGMTNVIWDVHVYPYQNNYSSDPTSIKDNITGMIAAAQKITSADGLMPVIIGESGPSTTGGSLDPNGYATVEGLINVASQGKMGGLAPFTWYPGFDSPNNITDSGGSVTSPYGQMVQLFVNTSIVACSQQQLDQQAQQTIASVTSIELAQEQQQSQQQASPESTPPPDDPSVAASNAQAEALVRQSDALVQKAQTFIQQANPRTESAIQAVIDQANADLQSAKATMGTAP